MQLKTSFSSAHTHTTQSKPNGFVCLVIISVYIFTFKISIALKEYYEGLSLKNGIINLKNIRERHLCLLKVSSFPFKTSTIFIGLSLLFFNNHKLKEPLNGL